MTAAAPATVAFRADASPTLGTGHVKRCLSIADELRAREAKVHFFTRPHGEYSEKLLDHCGVPVHALPADGDGGIAADAKAMKSAIAGLAIAPDWLIVDHYAVDERWERELRPGVRHILAIDDLADRKHDADALLDPNLYEDAERRYRDKVPAHCRLLLGPRYAVMREEFRRARTGAVARTGKMSRILVFFGGGPLAAACTRAAIQSLGDAGIRDVAVDVVFQADDHDRAAIAGACKSRGYFFHHATDRMAELMIAADFAVGAGGTTLWERCCLGLPCLTFALAENQRLQVRDAAAAGIVIASDSKPDDPDSLAGALHSIRGNPGLVAAVSRRAMAVVDGRGMDRLMRTLGFTSVRVRKAVAADSGPMLVWRNEPTVRKASRNSAPIDLATHQAWFDATLADSDRLLLIGELAGEPAGVVRFDIDSGSAEVSIYLLAGAAGRGLGADLLCAAENWLIGARPEVKTIRAEVLTDNPPSHALFAAAGYRLQQSIYSKLLRP
jgi:UDP-2,4-diacetamido-2,4,6-trideoxy-beta-L-altropyranose hydrolase